MPYVGRNTAGEIVEEAGRFIAGRAEEFLSSTSNEIQTWRGTTDRIDDRPTPRRTLQAKPDNTPVTVKDLKDLGLL